MKKIIFIFIVFVIFSSCRKDKSYTFTGTIYKNCDKEPAANREFYLRQEVEGGLGSTSGGEIAYFTTNVNGDFSVTYEDDNGASIELIASNSNPLIAGAPVMYRITPGNKDLGNLYINNRAIIDFFLDVNNPYTANDTLIILGNYVGTEIIGPFSNGLVYTKDDIPWTPYYGSIIAEGEKLQIGWGINPNSSGSFTYEYFEPTGCEERDEITIRVE